MMETTIVSAFLTDINEVRSTDIYLEYGKKLLNSKTNKIIFLEKKTIDLLSDYQNDNTKFIEIDRNEILKYKDLKLPDNRNVKKDTLNYMTLIIYKTEFVRKAIKA